MANLTHSFRFHVSPDYFPGYKIVTPVYAYVEMIIDEQFNGYVTGIMFPPSVFPIVSRRGVLVEEIEQLAAQIAESKKQEVCYAN
jgi:hypothetical protein